MNATKLTILVPLPFKSDQPLLCFSPFPNHTRSTNGDEERISHEVNEGAISQYRLLRLPISF